MTLFAVHAIACGGPPEPDRAADTTTFSENVQLEPQQPVDPLEVKNSGRTLSGAYSLESPSPPVVAASFVFTDAGTYSRSVTFGGNRGVRADSGTYILDDANNLHLFVEQRGDVRLNWAQRVTYRLSGDPAATMVLTATDSRADRLVRVGDPPAGAVSATPAE